MAYTLAAPVSGHAAMRQESCAWGLSRMRQVFPLGGIRQRGTTPKITPCSYEIRVGYGIALLSTSDLPCSVGTAGQNIMRHFNRIWITGMFLFVVQCNAEQATRDPNNSDSTEPKGTSSFDIVKTFPRYQVTDPSAYSALKRLAQTKPTFPPDTGLGHLASIWANLYVDSVFRRGMDGEQYMVSIFNELHPAPDGSLNYRLGLLSLSHVVTKRGNSVTRRIGYYSSPEGRSGGQPCLQKGWHREAKDHQPARTICSEYNRPLWHRGRFHFL